MEIITTKIGLAVLLPFMVVFEWWVDPVAPIDEPTFARIQNGMARRDVEKLLGSKASESQGQVSGRTLYTTGIWEGRGAMIVVFYADGKVSGKHFFQASLWQHMRDWMSEIHRHPDGGVSKRLKRAA